MKESTGAFLPVFVSANNLSEFIDADLRLALSQPIIYRPSAGAPANGLDATLLPKVCNIWLKARDKGVLSKSQQHIAAAADILMRGLAEVGIIALVDEATGYQRDRSADALTRILEAFISKELARWAKTFPDEYFREMHRLRGLASQAVPVP